MVGPVLGVVLNDEDQGRIGRFSTGNAFNDQPERKIVVGHLSLDGVHSVDGLVELTEMVVGETKQS